MRVAVEWNKKVYISYKNRKFIDEVTKHGIKGNVYFFNPFKVVTPLSLILSCQTGSSDQCLPVWCPGFAIICILISRFKSTGHEPGHMLRVGRWETARVPSQPPCTWPGVLPALPLLSHPATDWGAPSQQTLSSRGPRLGSPGWGSGQCGAGELAGSDSLLSTVSLPGWRGVRLSGASSRALTGPGGGAIPKASLVVGNSTCGHKSIHTVAVTARQAMATPVVKQSHAHSVHCTERKLHRNRGPLPRKELGRLVGFGRVILKSV